MNYIPRIVDKEINDLMEIMGAILIEVCKWCGKSGEVEIADRFDLQGGGY